MDRITTAYVPEALRRAEDAEERCHHGPQRLALCQAGTDKERQASQALGLGRWTPKRNTPLKVQPELALKLVSEGQVMSGGTQLAIQYCDQADMSFNGLQVPDLREAWSSPSAFPTS